MKTTKEQIQEIYNRIENCHPSREEGIKNRKAIILLAEALDDLRQDVIRKV
jgi:hypothetical protein